MTDQHPRCGRTEQAVGWALHALEPDEELAVERHLPTCATCRAAVRDTEAVMARLATAVEQVDPPPRLRSALLGAVATTPQEPRPPSRTATDRSGRKNGSRPRTLAAAALAAIAAVAVGGLGLRTWQLQQRLDTASAQAANTADLVRAMARPGIAHAVLATPDGTTVAAVVLDGGSQQVYTLDLAANPSDHIYVLWGLGDSSTTPQPLGAFDVAARDPGMRTVGSPSRVGFAAYAISLEPGRTAPATPTDVVASGQMRA